MAWLVARKVQATHSNQTPSAWVQSHVQLIVCAAAGLLAIAYEGRLFHSAFTLQPLHASAGQWVNFDYSELNRFLLTWGILHQALAGLSVGLAANGFLCAQPIAERLPWLVCGIPALTLFGGNGTLSNDLVGLGLCLGAVLALGQLSSDSRRPQMWIAALMSFVVWPLFWVAYSIEVSKLSGLVRIS